MEDSFGLIITIISFPVVRFGDQDHIRKHRHYFLSVRDIAGCFPPVPEGAMYFCTGHFTHEFPHSAEHMQHDNTSGFSQHNMPEIICTGSNIISPASFFKLIFSQSVSQQQDNMEATGLCLRPTLCHRVVIMLLLLPVNIHTYAGFPQIVPKRLQFFEDESFTLSCIELGGWSGWRVMWRTSEGETKPWGESEHQMSFYTITRAFPSDSGEYWCEGDEERSNSVNISVTDGSVILEIPSQPVMEGDTAILRCVYRTRTDVRASSFYKDGNFISHRHDRKMSLTNLSRSDEGLYKCKISGAGESSESQLMVKEAPEDPELSNNPPSSSHHLYLLFIPVLLLVVLVVVVVLLLWHKNQVTSTSLSSCTTPPLQPDPGVTSCSETLDPSSGTNLLLIEENSIYHTLD